MPADAARAAKPQPEPIRLVSWLLLRAWTSFEGYLRLEARSAGGGRGEAVSCDERDGGNEDGFHHKLSHACTIPSRPEQRAHTESTAEP